MFLRLLGSEISSDSLFLKPLISQKKKPPIHSVVNLAAKGSRAIVIIKIIIETYLVMLQFDVNKRCTSRPYCQL